MSSLQLCAYDLVTRPRSCSVATFRCNKYYVKLTPSTYTSCFLFSFSFFFVVVVVVVVVVAFLVGPKVDYNENKFAFEILRAVLVLSQDRKALSELIIHSVSCYYSCFFFSKHSFAL